MKIYADNAATTKMSRAAIEAMLPYMSEIYGNPYEKHIQDDLTPELVGADRSGWPYRNAVDLIRELKESGNTMIVVTHEMEFAKSVADVVIYMADGVIEEMGTPEQIFENPQSEKTRAFIQGTQEIF